NDWIDEATRAQLVRSSTDYRAGLAGELHKKLAALAAELALTGAPEVEAAAFTPAAGKAVEAAGFTPAAGKAAAAIDRLCRERDRTVHACRDGDQACIPSIPWSRCTAALVWFVGASP